MARRVRVDPMGFAEKWGRRLKGSTQDIRAGVEAVTESPTQLAASKADKMRANVLASIDSGKWQRGLQRVDLPTWKRLTLDKGLGRIGAGVDGATGKMQSFASELLPHIARLQQELDTMPDATIEDSITRMTHFVRGMSQFSRK